MASAADSWRMKLCGRCGATVAESAIKCPNCRSLLVSAPPPVSVPAPRQTAQWPGSFAPSPSAPPVVTSTRSAKTQFKRVVKLALAVLAGIFAYSVVVQVRRDNAPYSEAHQKAFVSGCKGAGGTETECNCSFDWIKQNIQGADFMAYVHAVNSPGYTPDKAPAWVYSAGQACGIHA